MSTGVGIAIGVGAIVLVFLYTKQQEKKVTAAIASKQQPTGPYALSIQDQLAVGTSILAGVGQVARYIQ